MKTIYDFKKNDVVTRVKPAKSFGKAISPFSGKEIELGRDRSYIGEKLIFVGIANGCAYFKRTSEIELKIFGNKMIDLELDVFDEGWDYWVDPETLLDSEIDYSTNSMSRKEIEEKISQAVSEENYELAEKLRKYLEK